MTEDSSPDHRVRGVREVVVEGGGGFTNYNRSALDRDSGSSLGERIRYSFVIRQYIDRKRASHGTVRATGTTCIRLIVAPGTEG
jgi:hypothetical protein